MGGEKKFGLKVRSKKEMRDKVEEEKKRKGSG
jgi:hypothetical protein